MKLLLTGAFKYTDQKLSILKNLGHEIIIHQDEKAPLSIDVSNIEAVICNALFVYNDIKDFNHLKYIQLTSAGYDRVPIEYIKKNNINIFNAHNVYSVPIAEWVTLKILEFYKSSSFFFGNQKNRIWEKKRNLLEMKNKTVSIVGYGNVGKEVAKRLASFDMKLIAVDVKRPNCQYIEDYFDVSELYSALRQSDVVVLTLPLTKETYHLIDEDALNQIKDQALIINVARGSIIEEKALIKQLKYGRFGGVGLDVFENEPLQKTSELWNFKNVSITPHNAFISEGNDERLFNLIVNNLKKTKI